MLIIWTEGVTITLLISTYGSFCSGNCYRHNHYNDHLYLKCSFVSFEDGPLEKLDSLNYYCQYRQNCQGTLEIVSSIIPTLPSSAFINYYMFDQIYIREVHMQKILPASFNSLNSLRVISLSDNNITTISDGIFNSLVSLRILDLSKNNIHNLSKHSLIGTHLDMLNLSFNALETFDDDFLSNIKVVGLDLSFNRFLDFNFSEIDLIQTLNLSNNHMKSVDGCFIDIQVLNLSKNEIDSFKQFICYNFNSTIRILDISYNYLTDLDLKAFQGHYNLQYLYLQNNNVSFIPHGCFSELKSLLLLNLSSNHIVHFEYGILDNMNLLKVLDVSNNMLNAFKITVYHSLRTLSELDLQQNEITNINADDLKTHIPFLNKINIDGNNFTCESLVEIFHNLKDKVTKGTSTDASNIYGIACSEDLNLPGSSNKEISEDVLNEYFQRTTMYKYFNKDFKNSNFFKFLESLKPNTKSNETNMSSYFNSDFRSSNFYKYLESLNKDRIALLGSVKDMQDYFNGGFRNSNFVRYLDSVKKGQDTSNGDFAQSRMYNYFNKDFESSNFYKFLEALKEPHFLIKYGENSTETRVEKLVSHSSDVENDNSAVLVVIVLLLVIIVCLLSMFMFLIYNKLNGFVDCSQRKSEEVELVGS